MLRKKHQLQTGHSNWVKVSYNNGYTSEFFSLKRVVRQVWYLTFKIRISFHVAASALFLSYRCDFFCFFSVKALMTWFRFYSDFFHTSFIVSFSLFPLLVLPSFLLQISISVFLSPSLHLLTLISFSFLQFLC